MEDYSNEENELSKNIDILTPTFDKFGLEVMNVGIQYADMLGGHGIRFFVEIMSDKELEETSHINIKANVYDSNGRLITMGSMGFSPKDFSGYDTIQVTAFGDTIWDNAAKARIYATK